MIGNRSEVRSSEVHSSEAHSTEVRSSEVHSSVVRSGNELAGCELDRVLAGDPPSGPTHRSLTADPRVGQVIDEIVTRHGRRLTLAVVGREGAGRDTMARALRERLAVTALGPGEGPEVLADVDLWVYVLVGAVRTADRKALSQLPSDRAIVVLGKTDCLADLDAARKAAAAASAEVGHQVTPVSALFACADVTTDEWDFLRELANGGAQMPSMAGHFLVGEAGSRECTMRTSLLRRIDHFGIDLALGLLANDPDSVPDAGALNALLHSISGMRALTPAITDRVGRVRYWREVQARAALERCASLGVGREVMERLLRVDEVRIR